MIVVEGSEHLFFPQKKNDIRQNPEIVSVIVFVRCMYLLLYKYKWVGNVLLFILFCKIFHPCPPKSNESALIDTYSRQHVNFILKYHTKNQY